MKLLIDPKTLSYRGVTVAAMDYARYAIKILNCDVIVSFDISFPYIKDIGTELEVWSELSKEFKVIPHNKTNIEKIIDKEKIDLTYFIHTGSKEWLPTNCRTAVHSVFRVFEPHGDSYAYVSQWLSESINSEYHTNLPYVPHIVNLPNPNLDLRSELGIGSDKIVIGRFGGYEQFNLDFVKQDIAKLLNYRNDFVFVFVNTRPWIQHPNVIYLDAIYNIQHKSNFINSCDVILHARERGESFGLAVAESLSQNKPVLSWEGGIDQNHVLMLSGSPTLYNQDNFYERLINCRDLINYENYSLRAEPFKPETVMPKFKDIFLS